jgi:hypothetical protein
MALTNLIQIISYHLNGLHRDSRKLISKRSQLFLSTFSEMAIAFKPAKTINERYEVRLIVYNPNQEVIEQWIE